ncbi:glycoside hydrolase family 18 protein [Mycena maculata]|uniref:Glycoside hydrolase family 18 protein n=1 Tax=Mycena maculata TaxID=230809 RepID=A0AAD7HV14_9AGAR|nr:glycoside hydrolase family 18 protein [Mycena maculata]
MVFFQLDRLAAVASAFLAFSLVSGVPTNGTALNDVAREGGDILPRQTSLSSPYWVIYGDAYVPGTTGPPPLSDITGYNVFILGFYLVEGPWDKVYEWANYYTASQRAAVKAQLAAAGVKLLISAFGSDDQPSTSGVDPVTMATTIANFVVEYNLDGVDVDYEDFPSFDSGTGAGEDWLISFTTQLRTILPVGQYIVTHAPVAPWFSPGIWGGGGYLAVNTAVGNLIDWYNVQFYNQGTTEYTTCAGLITESSTTWPGSALLQISASGVPLDKLVVGKPATTSDATNGFIAAATLAGCLVTAKDAGWTGGAMVWEYPDATTAWISTVRSETWPV